MLQRLRIKNFKLLRDVELELAPDVPTVLIGANSSGKSTVIEVLDFLARCATDNLEDAIIAHGGMNALRTIGVAKPIEIVSSWRVNDRELSWTLVFDSPGHGRVSVVAEELIYDGDTELRTNDAGVRLVQGPSSSEAEVTDRRKLAFEALVDEERYPVLGLLRIVVSSIRVIGSLSTAPAWARASDRPSARDAVVVSTQDTIGPEGVGLATALYNLQVEHADAWVRLERAFKGEFPFVKRIVFPADPGGSRISFAIEDTRFRGRSVFASEMSDGMVTFLCLLSLILHPDDVGTLALDEPDAHLHPSAIRSLLGAAHEPHRHHRTLIIVTHSNAVLDALDDPAVSLRIVDATAEGARIRTLDAGALAAWRTQYSMSQLRQDGLLDPSNGSYGDDE